MYKTMQMLFLKHLHMCFCPKNRRSGCPRADGGIVRHQHATIPLAKIKDFASLFTQRGPFAGYIPPVFARKRTFCPGKGGFDTLYYINIVYFGADSPETRKIVYLHNFHGRKPGFSVTVFHRKTKSGKLCASAGLKSFFATKTDIFIAKTVNGCLTFC